MRKKEKEKIMYWGFGIAIAIFLVFGGIRLFAVTPTQTSFNNINMAGYLGDFCNSAYSNLNVYWKDIGGTPALLGNNYYDPCAHYICLNNQIKLEGSQRTWGGTNTPLRWSGIDHPLDSFPLLNMAVDCPDGCETIGNTVRCREVVVSPTPSVNSTGIYTYSNYNTTFTVDFTALPVKSCNIIENWQSYNCDYVYYGYAVLPSKDANLNDAYQKNYIEVSSNVPKMATIGVEPFTPPTTSDKWIITSFLVVQNLQFKNGAWVENISYPPEYITAKDINGNYVPKPQQLEPISFWNSVGTFFNSIWLFIRALFGG